MKLRLQIQGSVQIICDKFVTCKLKTFNVGWEHHTYLLGIVGNPTKNGYESIGT